MQCFLSQVKLQRLLSHLKAKDLKTKVSKDIAPSPAGWFSLRRGYLLYNLNYNNNINNDDDDDDDDGGGGGDGGDGDDDDDNDNKNNPFYRDGILLFVCLHCLFIGYFMQIKVNT